MAGECDLEEVYERLFAWCEERDFTGHDPFDGLNSRPFQASPLAGSKNARFVFAQGVKRAPVDLRGVLQVPPGVNPKAIALFALAELSRARSGAGTLHISRADRLLDRLTGLGVNDGETLSYGYNFDWQSRYFYAPKGTPAIVPTAFASQAFSEGSMDEPVGRIAEFAATRLRRPVDRDDEICFSYTPSDDSVIYNASLLAAECLSRSPRPEHKELAIRAANFVMRRQSGTGSWTYGEEQPWVDNFHTAYVLLSLLRIGKETGTSSSVGESLAKGSEYWKKNFFLDDGTPRYYDDRTEPVDIHSAGVAIAAAAELGELELAEKVARWTIRNMRDSDGFFYYRVGKVIVDQTAFMRWGQAWMAYALARLLEARN